MNFLHFACELGLMSANSHANIRRIDTCARCDHDFFRSDKDQCCAAKNFGSSGLCFLESNFVDTQTMPFAGVFPGHSLSCRRSVQRSLCGTSVQRNPLKLRMGIISVMISPCLSEFRLCITIIFVKTKLPRKQKTAKAVLCCETNVLTSSLAASRRRFARP